MSRTTQGSAMPRNASRKGLSPATAAISRTFRSRRLVQSRGPTTPRRPRPTRFGLLPVRSPLLRESLLFSLPAGTKMFQFPAFASCHRHDGSRPGCRVVPFGAIRRSADHRPFAPTRGFSQLTTSFIASVSLGIHRTPLLSFPSFSDFVGFVRLPTHTCAPESDSSFCFSCANMSKILSPTEGQVENNGFEPLTPCLQSRCSSQLS